MQAEADSMAVPEPNDSQTYLLGYIKVLNVQHNEIGFLLNEQIDGDLTYPRAEIGKLH